MSKTITGATHELVAEKGVRETPPSEVPDSQVGNNIGAGIKLGQLRRESRQPGSIYWL
ncbi:hypothetical protein [Nostoc sp. NMS4]|uniref:hypothetical protein n=1 Tax=Nostoc sp. NMS4 TaxID=2815390 RepID=UPI0025FD00C8|nr:hypothetical protein [Nostoc sp. NMS4]